MDKRKSLLNVSVSVGSKVFTMVMAIVMKRLLIQYCGSEANGLNALYISIISFLSVSELGVGSAITFCMYKPIVEGNNRQVSALYQLFRKLYLLIGAIILTAGLCLTPFIHHFAKDYAELDINLYSTFVLMLISVVATYLFGAKTSLINAYKNNYITTAITSGGMILQYVLQIIILVTTGSFAGYLVCKIAAVGVQWGITEIVACRKYKPLTQVRAKIDPEIKGTLIKSIKAMFMHQIGFVLVNTLDSVIISACIGVVVLGNFSNYTMIMQSMMGILKIIFSSLTSIIGHLYVKESKETTMKYHTGFHMLNFILGMVFCLGFYAIIDELIALLFSAELVCERSIAFVVTLNGFVQFMRSGTLVFREATGTFYNDRWKPLVEGTANLLLSLLFVQWLGVTGVILATILTNLLICHIVEPYVLHKHAFGISPMRYCVRNYGFMAIFMVGMGLMNHFKVVEENVVKQLLINGSMSVGISAILCVAVLCVLRKQASYLMRIFRKG